MKEEIKQIVKELKELIKEEKLTKIDDKTILLSAVQIYNKPSKENYNTPKERNPNEPVTENQKNYLKKLGYDGTLNITKLEASALIDTYKKNQREEMQGGTDY